MSAMAISLLLACCFPVAAAWRLAASMQLPTLCTGTRLAFNKQLNSLSRGNVQLACIDEFVIEEGPSVRVFDGDFASDICEMVTAAAEAAIEEKGSFSLAIPGGSVVRALGGLSDDAFDFSKMHVYFVNENIGANTCYQGALDAFAAAKGVPLEQIHKVGEGAPAEVAAAYEQVLRDAASIDQSFSLPTVDMMLLGTGEDGHCGMLYPESDAVKASWEGKVVIPIDQGETQAIALSMDMMCSAKQVIVSAAGAGRAPMVAKALSGKFDDFECPAGLVDSVDTIWMVDEDSIAQFFEENPEEDEDEDEDEEFAA